MAMDQPVSEFVPEGQPRIAQQFIAGFLSQRNVESPVGTIEGAGIN
jgi:hypothetical protein